MNGERNGWAEWSKHVLIELERLNTKHEELDKKIDVFTVDQATAHTDLKNNIEQIHRDIKGIKHDEKDLQEKVTDLKDLEKKILEGDLQHRVGQTEGKMEVWHKIWLYILTSVILGYTGLQFFLPK